MRLYGKDRLKGRLDAIAKQDRLPHAILLHGSEGCGKKTTARYIAKLMLCGAPPCEDCPICRMTDKDEHPDVIFVRLACGGKYAAEPFRTVLKDTVVLPNKGAVKVYVFEDCDDMTPMLQNRLLKLIEEPAPHLRFIFTCENTACIIETILSRVTEFEVPDTPVSECAACLIEEGLPPERARELSETFGGNIGSCKAVIDGSEETRLVDAAKRAAAALARRDKYSFAAVLAEQTARADFSRTLELLCSALRDALAAGCGAEITSYVKKEALGIAHAFSPEEILHMLDVIFEANEHAQLNLNLSLTAAFITSRMF